MKKSMLIFIAFVMGLGLLSLACESGSGGTKVQITNSNAMAICEAYTSPVNQDTWGANIIPAGQQVAPGASLEVSGLANGQYDLKMVACDGSGEGTMQFSIP